MIPTTINVIFANIVRGRKKMLEEEKNNLYETFEAVMISANKEKMEMPKYKAKLEKTTIKVNFRLQIAQDEYFEKIPVGGDED